ncbi:hypothetical protein OIU79_031199 [Salix purpurea]|uniref:Uncharacterized protein n=1 Tax=Salix purpurea TaxID=77065 RepID=A0A9Q0VB40_SALPP|nr:hypothetical protein OIU79_031199 [Salix purpurea]
MIWKSVTLDGKNVKSLYLGYLKQYGWNSKDLKLCACLNAFHMYTHCLFWGELDFEDYMIEDRSCTFLERVELGFQLKLENLGRIKVDDEPFEKLFENFW